MKLSRKRALRNWLNKQSSWECQKRQPPDAACTEFFRKPYHHLVVYRSDGQCWNPSVGRTFEGAIGRLVKIHRLRIDNNGNESTY